MPMAGPIFSGRSNGSGLGTHGMLTRRAAGGLLLSDDLLYRSEVVQYPVWQGHRQRHGDASDLVSGHLSGFYCAGRASRIASSVSGLHAPNEGRHNATVDPRARHGARPALGYGEPCALADENPPNAAYCLHLLQLSFELWLESGPVVIKRSLHFRAHAHKRAAHLRRTSSSPTCTPAQPKLPVRFSAVALNGSH